MTRRDPSGLARAARCALLALFSLAASACTPRPDIRKSAASARAPSTPSSSDGKPSRAAAEADAQRSDSPSSDQSKCTAQCNGVWGAWGLIGTPFCNCRTRDFGRRCLDQSDCEGSCVAEQEPEREIVDPGPPARGYFVGRCSELVKPFGCLNFVRGGPKKQPPLDLSTPMEKLCID